MDESNPSSESEYGAIVPRQGALRLELATCFGLFVMLTILSTLLSPHFATLSVLGANATVGTSLYGIAFSVSEILLIGYIIFASGDAVSMFGIVKPRLLRDVGMALPVLFVAWFGGALAAQLAEPNPMPLSWELIPFAFAERPLAFCIAAFEIALKSAVEELVFRGYFLTRLIETSNSRFWGMLASTLCFAAVHIYQGPGGIASALVIGAVFAWSTIVTRSLIPAMIAHAAFNLLGEIVWPF